MLKWFNTYGKRLMVFIMVILMIAFLVPQGVSMFQPDPGAQPKGTIAGEELTYREVDQASFTVDLLKRMGIAPFGNDNEEEGLRWALIQHDAKENLGLDAGLAEVDSLLASSIDGWGVDDATNQRLALERVNQPAYALRAVIQEFLIFQKYSQLIFGLPNAPEQYGQMQQLFMQQGRAASVERLSAPALERLVVNNGTPATGRVLVLDAERYLSKVEVPTETELLTVFEKYNSEPANTAGRFGYQYPDRVKMEILTIPFEAAMAKVPAPAATEVSAFFEANQEQFEGKTEYEARPQIIDGLKQQAAIKLAREATDRARDILTRALTADDLEEQADGSLTIPASYVPMALTQVADEIQASFGFKPELGPSSLANNWTSLRDISLDPALQTIGFMPRPNQAYPLAQYLASAKEFQVGDTPHPLSQLGLQVGVPSRALVQFTLSQQPQAFVIARLIAAEPERVSSTMTDDIRPQVTADAMRLAAFELLKEEAAQWESKLSSGLDTIAIETSSSSQPFTGPRRQITPLANELLPPEIPGIGRSQVFIDAVFSALGPENTTPANGSALIEDQQKLALFEISDITNMTQSAYTTEATSPIQVLLLGSALSGSPNINEANPISLDALKERVKWVPSRSEVKASQDEEEAETQSA